MLKIFTLNWNGKDKLKQLRAGLLPSLEGFEWEWWVKDNASKDGSVELLRAWEDNTIKPLYFEHNRDSFALGMNRLFKAAAPEDEDLIMLLNNDVEFKDNFSIKNMVELFNDESVGVVGAKLNYPNSTKLQHAGVIFSKRYGNLCYHYKHKEEETVNERQNRKFQAVTGAVLLTKAKYYKNVCINNESEHVGMDERYFWAFEDVDLCLAIKYNMNKKIIYCGKTNIEHIESATLNKNPVNKVMMPQNVKIFKEKWWGKYTIDHDLYLKDPKYNAFNMV